MKIIDGLLQGSDEWLALRLRHRCASEAAAANGESKYMKRGELLRMKATGLQREFSDYVQKHVLDRGHENEARARALVETELGQELFPVTGTTDDGYLWASVDGLTMDDEILFESKSWNEDLAAQVRAGSLEPHYYWQLEQGLAVTGAKKAIFACSDGTPDRHITMEYFPVPGRREQLLAIWRQFDADLAAWRPEDQPAPVQKLVAEPVEALPAVILKVSGAIALEDNFDAVEAAVRRFLDEKLIREPKEDQDFADLDQQIKAMKGAEDALDAAEVQMLAQVQSVHQAKRRKDMLKKLVRDNRLMAEKLLSSEKERRKGELVAEGIAALREHVAGLNKTIGRDLMPATATAADFGAAIKGMRSLDSMRDAIAATLARAKIAANETQARILANLKAIEATGQPALFADLSTLVLKDVQDCAAQVENRVAQARAREEQQRQRIREEEAEKLRNEQPTQASAAAQPPAATTAPFPAPAPQVVQLRPAAGAKPTMKLGDVNARIAPLSITADGLASLGFTATKERNAALYHEEEFASMCDALRLVLERARDGVPQAA